MALLDTENDDDEVWRRSWSFVRLHDEEILNLLVCYIVNKACIRPSSPLNHSCTHPKNTTQTTLTWVMLASRRELHTRMPNKNSISHKQQECRKARPRWTTQSLLFTPEISSCFEKSERDIYGKLLLFEITGRKWGSRWRNHQSNDCKVRGRIWNFPGKNVLKQNMLFVSLCFSPAFEQVEYN